MEGRLKIVKPAPIVTTHNPPIQLQFSFHGFENIRLVFHGPMSAFVGFQGLRLIFMGQGHLLWVFKVPGWFFEVLGRFFMVPDGFLVIHSSW